MNAPSTELERLRSAYIVATARGVDSKILAQMLDEIRQQEMAERYAYIRRLHQSWAQEPAESPQ